MKANLDEWDFKVISRIKHSNGADTSKLVINLFVERVSVDIEYISIQDVLNWLVDIIGVCKKPIHIFELIKDAHPAQAWKFGADGEDYYSRWLAVFISFIRLMRVDEIPGYQNWLDYYKTK